mmetsp:Transcript_48041/g.139150  ORF Transcript_48041/g.139150 Transcript_48041/m.139150 type:complete len:229 (-) Transcript_48041:58-744(-)
MFSTNSLLRAEISGGAMARRLSSAGPSRNLLGGLAPPGDGAAQPGNAAEHDLQRVPVNALVEVLPAVRPACGRLRRCRVSSPSGSSSERIAVVSRPTVSPRGWGTSAGCGCACVESSRTAPRAVATASGLNENQPFSPRRVLTRSSGGTPQCWSTAFCKENIITERGAMRMPMGDPSRLRATQTSVASSMSSGHSGRIRIRRPMRASFRTRPQATLPSVSAPTVFSMR